MHTGTELFDANQTPIHVIRQTLDQLAAVSVDPTGALLISGATKISTVCFRAGYRSIDYPTAAQYGTRFLLFHGN